MNVTGQIYTQIYSRTGGKFIELNSGYAISLGVRTANTWGITPNLTGYNFPLPIVASRIEAMPIAIGSRVGSGSGLYSVNIGMLSANSMSPQYANSGYLGAFNFGTSNFSTNGFNVYNYGSSNSHNEDSLSFNLGFQNQTTGSQNILSEGISNYINQSNILHVLGKSNIIESGNSLYVVGSQNTLTNLNQTNVIGDGNNIGLINSSEIFGKINTITGSEITTGNNYLSIFGDSNTITYSNLLDIFGSENLVVSSSGNYIFGNLNSLSNATLALIVGNNNFSTDTGNLIFGANNSIQGANSAVYGTNNLTYFQTNNNLIFGGYNVISGAVNSTILGSENTLTRQDDLTTGNSNLILGDGNILSSTASSYVLGLNNQLNNTDNNFIIGDENISKEAISSYVFGKNNSVSGYQNYVIGNNNEVRTGDYNSIFIGLGYTPTGAFKTSTVNIAAGFNTLEVSPSLISLNSSARPKINNENILVDSDLNTYLNYTNGLGNSGLLLTNTFQDAQYNHLADKIELSSFIYSGTQDRYYGGFSGSGSNYVYSMSGFFRKIETINYSGIQNIYGNYFYQSNDFKFTALFSRELNPVLGSWIITKSYNLDSGSNNGVFYYNPSTNTGVFPTNGWIATGYNGLSGSKVFNPSFSYQGSFTGKFQQKVLDSISSVGTNYFDSLAEKTYVSNEDGISLLYGNLTVGSPLTSPAWMIVDNFSSGIYYINTNYNSTTLPQTGWKITGFAGYTGMINEYIGDNPPRLVNETGVNIVIGSRQAYISSFAPSFGRIYIPFLY